MTADYLLIRHVCSEEKVVYPIKLYQNPYSMAGHNDLVVDGARGDAAEREPGRELGGVVRAEHAVARVKVARHAAAVPQVVLQARQRGAFASHKVYRPLHS